MKALDQAWGVRARQAGAVAAEPRHGRHDARPAGAQTPDRPDSPDFVAFAHHMTRLPGIGRAALRPARQTSLGTRPSGWIVRRTQGSASEGRDSGFARSASRRLPHRAHDQRQGEVGRR
jgi:hypothetical protein